MSYSLRITNLIRIYEYANKKIKMKIQNLKLNKTTLSILILAGMFFVFSFSSANAYTETHYVTQNGAGSKNGRSLVDAWALSSFHNTANWSTSKAIDSKIGPADVVYFSGNFTDRVVVTHGGSSAGSITLDGYEAGDCDPINNVCLSAALLKNGIVIGNNISGPDYLILQDFRMTGGGSWYSVIQLWPDNDGTDDQNNIDYTIIRRCYAYKGHVSLFTHSGGRYNIIEKNKFVNMCQGSDSAQAVNFISVKNSLVSNNEFGHDENNFPSHCTSANIVEIHGSKQMLFEKNNVYGAWNGAGLTPKEGYGGNSDLVFRFNKSHSHIVDDFVSGSGISIHTNSPAPMENVYVYGNLFYNNKSSGINFGCYITNSYIWANVIHSAGSAGVYTFGLTGCSSTGLYVYNNTISYNSINAEDELARGGISIGGGIKSAHIKNNILWNNRPGGEMSRMQIYGGSGTRISTMEHNTYYHPSGSITAYYDSGYRSLPILKSAYGLEDDLPAGIEENPLFIDPNGADNIYGTADDNYRLSASSPVKNSGKPLSGTFSVNLSNGDSWFQSQTGYSTLTFGLNDALDPAGTDWTANPPIVKSAKQDSAKGWSRGAYAYSSSSNLLPGDFNGDNKVNTLDYEIMKREFLKTGTNLKSDMNKDGKVNTLDYELFRREFGKKK